MGIKLNRKSTIQVVFQREMRKLLTGSHTLDTDGHQRATHRQTLPELSVSEALSEVL